MGGRGSSGGGRSGRAPNGYRTVGKIRNAKVIQDKKTGKGLPMQGPPMVGFIEKGEMAELINLGSMIQKDGQRKT